MSREPRRIEPQVTYHLISRLVDREWFINTDDERRHYRILLARALAESDWRCLAFAIMSNHLHLAAVAGAQPLSAWIRRVHAPFATAMNRAYDRIGPMFVRGPKALPVESSRIGNVIAYIHNNPARAHVVEHAAQSDWTSHREYLGLVRCPQWLHVEEGLTRSGFNPTDALAFDAWVRDPAQLDFDRVYEKVVMEKVSAPTRPRAPLAAPTTIVTATASELGIPIERLLSRRRGALEVVGREIAVYCASQCGLLGADIARALGVTQQAVSHIRTRRAHDHVESIGQRVISRIKNVPV